MEKEWRTKGETRGKAKRLEDSAFAKSYVSSSIGKGERDFRFVRAEYFKPKMKEK